MKPEWKKQLPAPCPERSRRNCDKGEVQQCRQVVVTKEPEPKPQSKELPWPQSLGRHSYTDPQTVSVLRGVRLTMAVLLPGLVLGAQAYRSVQRARDLERLPMAEPEASELDTEEDDLGVQQTPAAQVEDDSEVNVVWKTVYDHGRGQQQPSDK